jgi:hypothetical protein
MELRLTVPAALRGRRIPLPELRGVIRKPQAGEGKKGAEKAAKAGGKGKKAPAEIFFPEAGSWRVRTSLIAPLGKYVLAGAFSLAPAVDSDRTALVLVRVNPAGKRKLLRGLLPAKKVPGAKVVQKVYDVRALTFGHQHFPGPQLGMTRTPAGGGCALVVPAPPAGSAATGGALCDAIKRTIEPESWGVNNNSITEQSGRLIVVHTEAVHKKIPGVISWMRKQVKRQVAVRALIVPVGDAAAAQVRRRGSAEFDPAEVEGLIKAAGARTVEAEVRCFNTQRVYLSCIQEICEPVLLPANEPDARVVRIGWVFDVRPVLGPERKNVSLEVRLSRSGRGFGGKGRAFTVRGVHSLKVGKYVRAATLRIGKGKRAKTALVFLTARVAD